MYMHRCAAPPSLTEEISVDGYRTVFGRATTATRRSRLNNPGKTLLPSSHACHACPAPHEAIPRSSLPMTPPDFPPVSQWPPRSIVQRTMGHWDSPTNRKTPMPPCAISASHTVYSGVLLRHQVWILDGVDLQSTIAHKCNAPSTGPRPTSWPA
jgi:hypothetical protein